MLWDGLFLVVLVVLAVNGWNRGLVASWRGPLAIVGATAIVQHLYVDFAAWVAMRLRVGPAAATTAAYLMLWFSTEAVLEIVLALVLRWNPKRRPIFADRLGGAFYGLAKAAVIAIFPLMAASVDNHIPPPPQDRSGLVLPSLAGAESSILMPGFSRVALSLLPGPGRYIVSTSPPSFTPSYEGPEEGSQRPASRPSGKELDNVLR